MGNVSGKAALPEDPDQDLQAPLTGQRQALSDSIPLFPLDDELVRSLLTTFATGALTGISTINGFAAFVVGPSADVGALQALLHMSPFTFLPIGIMGVVLSVAATKSKRYIGVAMGFLLFELLYTIILGGLCSIVKLKEGVGDQGFWAVVGITFVLCITVILCWSFVFPYPKCLRKVWAAKVLTGSEAAKEASSRAVEAAAEAKKAMEDAVQAWKDAEEFATRSKKAADDALAAEHASSDAVTSELNAGISATAARRAAEGAARSAAEAMDAAGEAKQAESKAKEGQLSAEQSCENAKTAVEAAEAASERAAAMAPKVDAANNV